MPSSQSQSQPLCASKFPPSDQLATEEVWRFRVIVGGDHFSGRLRVYSYYFPLFYRVGKKLSSVPMSELSQGIRSPGMVLRK